MFWLGILFFSIFQSKAGANERERTFALPQICAGGGGALFETHYSRQKRCGRCFGSTCFLILVWRLEKLLAVGSLRDAIQLVSSAEQSKAEGESDVASKTQKNPLFKFRSPKFLFRKRSWKTFGDASSSSVVVLLDILPL